MHRKMQMVVGVALMATAVVAAVTTPGPAVVDRRTPSAPSSSRPVSNGPVSLLTTPRPGALVIGPSGPLDPSGAAGAAPPTDAACVQAGAPYGINECLTPGQVRTAYGVAGLLRRGDTGRGQTIVVVDSYGSPTLASDLRTFDAGYHLPAPPSLRVLAPLGRVRVDESAPEQAGWAGETTLDVEWSHAMAPGAAIVVLTSPVDETEGTAGLGDFLALERYAVDHRLGHIISQSWGATEGTLRTRAGAALVARFQRFYARADAARYSILASTGDAGSQNASNATGTVNYPYPTVEFPASSPYVTAVGGTALRVTAAGRWTSERVWNDGSGNGAGGGGVSRLFAEPAWQRFLPVTVQRTLGGHRGVPDVAWNSAVSTSILTYESYQGPAGAGWHFAAGTSEAAPQWAGLVADVNQARHDPIGFLDPILYRLGEAPFHDIVRGDNAYGGVAGYGAHRGWDAASGLGTPRAGALSAALVRARAA